MKGLSRSAFLGISVALAACTVVGRQTSTASEGPQLDRDFASRAVQLSLHCVDTEDPHYNEGQGTAPHAEKLRHPAFYGCYDWHSAVHGHWAMLRAADVVSDLAEREGIVATLNRHLSPENLRAELDFVSAHPSFEVPYGWGWALRLVEELRLSKIPEAKSWLANTAPFESFLVRTLRGFLAGLKEPNRVGTHDNTAYAMIHAFDYSVTTGQPEFRAFLEKRARELYLKDQNCALASEPGPYDFISPCFVEADLMRRVLPVAEFREWYGKFLPDVRPEQLKPVPPTDLHNPYQVHLVGLMYEKSSAMTGVAHTLAEGDPRRTMLLDAVKDQIDTAGKLMFQSDYGGTHWLASFAIYYYSGEGL
jgi:hypothetical protein